jgi:hypothetical protein
MPTDNPDLSFDAPCDLSFSDAVTPTTAAEKTGIASRSARHMSAVRRFYDLRNTPNAARLISPLPAPSETIHAIMGGDFSAWDLVPALLGQAGHAIELVITTLGFNHANNEHLCELLDAGAIRAAWVVCSEYFKGADPDVYAAASERLAARGARLTATRNHSKVILLMPLCGNGRYVFESSANLRSCNNLEQFTLTNAPEVYDFHRAWILSLFK